MKLFILLAAGLLATATFPGAITVFAQPTPVQTISLDPREMLGGVVHLTNQNTVLLLSNSETPDVRVRTLGPDGQTLWEAKLTRFQQIKGGSRRSGLFAEAEEETSSSTLAPVQVYTSGNDLYAVEIISENVARKQGKGGELKAGQVLVQHLNEKGQLDRAAFDAPAEIKRVDRRVLSTYVEDGVLYRITEERNEREDMAQHVLEKYPMATRKMERVLLKLPETPERTRMNVFYNEWGYLGHRAGQTYMFRRLKGHGKKESFRDMPMEYQILTLDNNGATTGGFTTTLGLEPKTQPAYSAYSMPQLQEQQHLYKAVTRGKYIYDEYDVSSGGIGEFFLDYATGEVLIFGEFSKDGDFGNQEGLFVRRYDVSGKVVQQTQTLYPKEMKATAPNAFAGSELAGAMRSYMFSLDPLDGSLEFGIRKFGMMGGGGGLFRVRLDKDLKYLGYSYQEKDKSTKGLLTPVNYVSPFWLYKRDGTDTVSRLLGSKINSFDAPAYAALEKLRLQPAAKASDKKEYYLSPTGAGSGLLLERITVLGGKLSVYKI
ncbi:hypothetical protein LJY25_08040 [Hymenobacter sp. BT175]|uniref:hypothetical protein n=1 Tax=Hymenobacter translucens TaxID=2886507 RepID=UPI001D0EC633|nr:hypothetical protein [Hymenobacter translucens]MCC2546392.1 hypothetical protein [Hymenobacter translucens]